MATVEKQQYKRSIAASHEFLQKYVLPNDTPQ